MLCVLPGMPWLITCHGTIGAWRFARSHVSPQGVALVAWVGASVAQVEALRADLMYLDAGLICLVPGLVLHVHGLAKKSCKSRDHFWPRKS